MAAKYHIIQKTSKNNKGGAHMTDTCAAISTAIGKAGISVIRISGDEAVSIADKIFKTAKNKKKYSAVLKMKKKTKAFIYIISVLLAAALFSVTVCNRLFLMNGTVTRLPWMIAKLLFFICTYIGASTVLSSLVLKVPNKAERY
jgi:hypothetical protein